MIHADNFIYLNKLISMYVCALDFIFIHLFIFLYFCISNKHAMQSIELHNLLFLLFLFKKFLSFFNFFLQCLSYKFGWLKLNCII